MYGNRFKSVEIGRSCLAGAKPFRHTVYVNWYRQINSYLALRPDGINVLQILTQNAGEVRKLFWSHEGNAQRAARDGDYKYLKILDNTFLFNVVEDPDGACQPEGAAQGCL